MTRDVAGGYSFVSFGRRLLNLYRDAFNPDRVVEQLRQAIGRQIRHAARPYGFLANPDSSEIDPLPVTAPSKHR